jgi:serine/threonine-protein kinase
VISQHVSAPAIADRKPELSGLGPVLSKALAKSPGDRYDTCMDFANAVARHLDVVVGDLGASDATMAPVAPSRRHGKEPKSRKLPLVIPSAILIALLIAGAAAAVILTGRHQNEAVPQQRPPAASGATAAGACGGMHMADLPQLARSSLRTSSMNLMSSGFAPPPAKWP